MLARVLALILKVRHRLAERSRSKPVQTVSLEAEPYSATLFVSDLPSPTPASTSTKATVELVAKPEPKPKQKPVRQGTQASKRTKGKSPEKKKATGNKSASNASKP